MATRKRLHSSVVIAKMLKSEGFSDHVANEVERYWMKNIARGTRRVRNLDKNMSEVMKKLDDGEKLIVGKFISMHKRQSFDTGLRIGLTAFAVKNDKEFDEAVTADD